MNRWLGECVIGYFVNIFRGKSVTVAQPSDSPWRPSHPLKHARNVTSMLWPVNTKRIPILGSMICFGMFIKAGIVSWNLVNDALVDISKQSSWQVFGLGIRLLLECSVQICAQYFYSTKKNYLLTKRLIYKLRWTFNSIWKCLFVDSLSTDPEIIRRYTSGIYIYKYIYIDKAVFAI